MAMRHSLPSGDRRARRRAQTIDEVLAHAVEIMAESGVGSLSISEIARRMGIQPPSVYKYFPSLHAVYDALFGEAARDQLAASKAAMGPQDSAIDRLMAGAVAVVRWSIANPPLAQLMFWRPVPGFQPSADSLAPNIEAIEIIRTQIIEAIQTGQLASDTNADELLNLCTVIINGVISQQLSNEPGVPYDAGRFSSLTERALETAFAAYRPGRKP